MNAVMGATVFGLTAVIITADGCDNNDEEDTACEDCCEKIICDKDIEVGAMMALLVGWMVAWLIAGVRSPIAGVRGGRP